MIDNKDLAAVRALMKGAGGGTGGGGTSIDVTAQVGQTIVVKEVDANGKPTAWESADYQPRTHWSEVVTILPETTVETPFDEGIGAGVSVLPDMDIVGGETYHIMYNGVEYVCYCSDVGEGILALGNFEGKTNEPFMIIREIGDIGYVWYVGTLDGSTSVTMSIIEEAVTQISEKYIPKNYFEISVTDNDKNNSGAYNLTYDTTELANAITQGKQIFINVNYSDSVGRLTCYRTQAISISIPISGVQSTTLVDTINLWVISGQDIAAIPFVITGLSHISNPVDLFKIYTNLAGD